MAQANKFNQAVEDIMHGVHNFSSHQLVVALCASANAPVATNSILANLTQISYTNLSSRNITTASSEGSDGSHSVGLTDLVLTASGGAVAAFRYIVVYNDTPTSPADPLLFWYDYGSALTLNDGESLTIDFAADSITLS